MSLRDFFKRKKPKIEEKKEEEVVKEPEEVKEVKKERPKVQGRKKRKADQKIASSLLKSPHITEKATDLQAKGQYTFRVSLNSNKTEIKKVIEQLYDVDVVSVKIIKVPRKKRRVGKVSGWKKGYKKAIIKVGKGQKIEELTI